MFHVIKTIIRLLPFLKINIHVIAAFFLTATMIGLNISLPLLFRSIITLFTSGNQISSINVYIILFFYAFLWSSNQVISLIRSIVVFRVLENSARNLSLNIFKHMHTLSMRFHIDRKIGAITSYIDRAQIGFDNIFWGLFLFLVPAFIEITLAICVITYLYSIVYGGIMFLIICLYILLTLCSMNFLQNMHKEYNEKRSQASASFIDSLLNAEVVKYFGSATYDYQNCKAILQEQERASIRRYFWDGLIQFGQYIIIGLGFAIVIIKSGIAVFLGSMNISDFILVNGYVLQFIMPLQNFGFVIRQIHQGFNDMGQVLYLLDLKPEIYDSPNSFVLTSDRAEIVFDNVTFGYNNQRPILKNISFTIPAHRTIALVGPSGSGKSTIARLLFHFYNIEKGAIFFNGLNIKNITQDSLNKAIGIVPQDTTLFNNTLYYNIAYGRPSALEHEVQQVIDQAHLRTLIDELPAGYNTIVGERGLALSGGERQRIAIARMLLKRPLLYIFDEATASLDTRTEQAIQQHIKDIALGATTLIIAHRLSTIAYADKIIVLDQGIITEQGTHEELLNNKQLYAQLWHKQELVQQV